MMAYDTLIGKWSDKNMEGDEGLRTLECLRGRLLAERASSKAANHESELISKKVTELENRLKIEIKSRNKAEKRLQFLIKKLQSLNISYVSPVGDDDNDDDDFSSCVSEKSEISSVSSSKSQQYHTGGERHNCPSHQHTLKCENVIQSSKKDDEHGQNGSKSPVTKNAINNEEHDQDPNDNVDNSKALVIFNENVNTKTPHIDKEHDDNFDNSMSLVVVDSIVKEEKQDLSKNVKDVLDALKYARESLQASMKMRRHMNSNMARARPNRISC